jgi:hypothetical protein
VEYETSFIIGVKKQFLEWVVRLSAMQLLSNMIEPTCL